MRRSTSNVIFEKLSQSLNLRTGSRWHQGDLDLPRRLSALILGKVAAW
jgi:hypothetical protein